jgi:hypothetical protein
MIYTTIMKSVNIKITEMQKKVGRPPGRTQPRPFQMKVNDAFIATIDDWRRRQADFPNRTESIRRLIESHPEIKALSAVFTPAPAKPAAKPPAPRRGRVK